MKKIDADLFKPSSTWHGRSLHRQIANELGPRIISGEIEENTALPNEAELSLRLNVSRTALREAIKLLSSKGMVTSKPKTGTVISERRKWNYLDPDVLHWTMKAGKVEIFLRRLFELRFGVEPMAAFICALQADEDQINSIERNFDGMLNSMHSATMWTEYDLAFHKAIYDGTNNEFFWSVGQLFSDALEYSFYMSGEAGAKDRCIEEHRDVLTAIMNRNPEQARSMMTHLVSQAGYDIRQVIGVDPSASITGDKKS